MWTEERGRLSAVIHFDSMIINADRGSIKHRMITATLPYGAEAGAEAGGGDGDGGGAGGWRLEDGGWRMEIGAE